MVWISLSGQLIPDDDPRAIEARSKRIFGSQAIFDPHVAVQQSPKNDKDTLQQYSQAGTSEASFGLELEGDSTSKLNLQVGEEENYPEEYDESEHEPSWKISSEAGGNDSFGLELEGEPMSKGDLQVEKEGNNLEEYDESGHDLSLKISAQGDSLSGINVLSSSNDPQNKKFSGVNLEVHGENKAKHISIVQVEQHSRLSNNITEEQNYTQPEEKSKSSVDSEIIFPEEYQQEVAKDDHKKSTEEDSCKEQQDNKKSTASSHRSSVISNYIFSIYQSAVSGLSENKTKDDYPNAISEQQASFQNEKNSVNSDEDIRDQQSTQTEDFQDAQQYLSDNHQEVEPESQQQVHIKRGSSVDPFEYDQKNEEISDQQVTSQERQAEKEEQQTITFKVRKATEDSQNEQEPKFYINEISDSHIEERQLRNSRPGSPHRLELPQRHDSPNVDSPYMIGSDIDSGWQSSSNVGVGRSRTHSVRLHSVVNTEDVRDFVSRRLTNIWNYEPSAAPGQQTTPEEAQLGYFNTFNESLDELGIFIFIFPFEIGEFRAKSLFAVWFIMMVLTFVLFTSLPFGNGKGADTEIADKEIQSAIDDSGQWFDFTSLPFLGSEETEYDQTGDSEESLEFTLLPFFGSKDDEDELAQEEKQEEMNDETEESVGFENSAQKDVETKTSKGYRFPQRHVEKTEGSFVGLFKNLVWNKKKGNKQKRVLRYPKRKIAQ